MFINILVRNRHTSTPPSPGPARSRSLGSPRLQAAGVVGPDASVFNGLGRLGCGVVLGPPGPLQHLYPLFALQIARLLVPAEHHQHHPVPGSALPDSYLLRGGFLDAAGRRSAISSAPGELGAVHGVTVLSLMGHGRGLSGPQMVARPPIRPPAPRDGEGPRTVLSSAFVVVALAVSIMMGVYAGLRGPAISMTTVTVFSFDGKDFTRVQTTLLTDDGKSAVNTKLDRGFPSYQADAEVRCTPAKSIYFRPPLRQVLRAAHQRVRASSTARFSSGTDDGRHSPGAKEALSGAGASTISACS